MSAQIGYVPKAILKELRFSDYFKVSCFRWGIYSWIEFYKQKFSKATAQQSYEALHDELEILLQRLSKVSKVYAKTKSLQESLQVISSTKPNKAKSTGRKRQIVEDKVDVTNKRKKASGGGSGREHDPYMIDNIDIIAKLNEQKQANNYEAAFYDILDLSEEKQKDSIRSKIPSEIWRRLKSMAKIDMITLSDDVRSWLATLDDKGLIENTGGMGKVLYRLSGCILVATPSLQYDFRYIHRIYQHFMDLWMDNPNPLLDKDMSEVTQVIDAISPMLKNLFRGKYRIKWGEIGLEASSFRRNQDVDTNIRRRPGQRTDAILSLRNQLGQELLICEISGQPYDNDLEHFGGDKLKIQKGLRDILNLIAQRAENGDINIFMRLKIYGLQIYGWKAYLYAMDIPHHNLYRFEQVASFRIPQSPEDLLWLPAAIHVLLSLRVWIDQTAEDLEKLYRSSVRTLLEGKQADAYLLDGYISKTLDTPDKKAVKHPARA